MPSWPRSSSTRYGARLLHARFPPVEPVPTIEIVSRFRTRGRAVILDGSTTPATLGNSERTLYLAATAPWCRPTDS